MGTMQATCGHLISLEWMTGGESDIFAKAHTREGRRAVSYLTVCPECRKWYIKEKLILYTEQDKIKWMRIRGRNGKRKQTKPVS